MKGVSMEGVSVQDMLGKDLSEASVDDLLAAMKSSEGERAAAEAADDIAQAQAAVEAAMALDNIPLDQPIPDMPAAEAPVVEEAAAMPEMPVMEEAPAMAEAPVVEEAAAMPETPVMEEAAQAMEAAPEIAEAPVVEEAAAMPEMPVMEEAAPAMEAAPEMAEAPVVEEAAAMPEMPVMEEAAPAMEAMPEMPVMEEAPSMAEAPVVEEAAAMPEMQVMEETPAMEAAPEMAETPAMDEAPAMDAAPAPAADDENADISAFLSDNDYEYVTVASGNVTRYIVKKVGGAMCVQYEDGEFVAFNRNYEYEDYSTYGGILFSFIKEAIQGTGCDSLVRHKGTNIN